VQMAGCAATALLLCGTRPDAAGASAGQMQQEPVLASAPEPVLARCSRSQCWPVLRSQCSGASLHQAGANVWPDTPVHVQQIQRHQLLPHPYLGLALALVIRRCVVLHHLLQHQPAAADGLPSTLLQRLITDDGVQDTQGGRLGAPRLLAAIAAGGLQGGQCAACSEQCMTGRNVGWCPGGSSWCAGGRVAAAGALVAGWQQLASRRSKARQPSACPLGTAAAGAANDPSPQSHGAVTWRSHQSRRQRVSS
jgi:hypothetical protein